MRRILTLTLLAALASATAIAEVAPTCSISADDAAGKLRVSWQRGDCKPEGSCHEGDSGMEWSRWTGITLGDLQHEGMSIDARMKAEAGEMRCVGTVHDSELHGSYSFTPDPEFARRMETLGFHDLNNSERLQGYAMLDVTTDWVKQMKAAGVSGMNSDNLLGLKALGVDPAYVHAMAADGYPELDAGKLTGMKAVGVTPEKVRQIRAMGYSPTQEELIQMSVFKIDAPFVERMKARGLTNLTIAKLVQIKVFKLDE